MPCYVGFSTATESRDPGSTDEKRNVRRKHETGSDEENLRGAVLLRFPCEQCHTCISAWLDKALPGTGNENDLRCSLQEWQQVGQTCLCSQSHVPAIRGTV